MSRFSAWLLAALLGTTAAAEAGNLTVAPTRVDLAAGRTAGAVTLHNNADEPVLVQVETFAWPRTPASGDLEATRSLVAVPPVFSLPPNGTQIIRIALREPQRETREQAYRLLITEVPQTVGKAGGVQFALRLSLPVFATPAGAAAEPQWSLRTDADGSTLELVNAGTAHVQVRQLKVAGGSDAPEIIAAPSYVLAGQRRSWKLRSPVRPGTVLTLEADTSLGPLAFPLTAGGG